MKKKISILLATVMSMGCLLGATACSSGNGQAEEGTLTIRYFEGGYGSAWLKQAAETYKAENPDFKYNLIPNKS